MVADNDDDPAAQFLIVKNAIAATGCFGVPNKPGEVATAPPNSEGHDIPKVVALMLPSENEIGGMERVLLKAGIDKNKDVSDCIDSFMGCTKADQWSAAMRDKLKARIMLSASAKTKPTVPFSGAWESQSGNPFPLDHKAFDDIADFFMDLLTKV